MRVAVVLFVLGSSLAPRAAAQAEFQRLGHLPGGGAYSVASDLSADGAVVVGSSDQNYSSYLIGFGWTAATGPIDLGDLPGAEYQSAIYAISPDGSHAVGSSRTTDDSYWQWHATLHDGTALFDLGTLPYISDGWSYATDVSNGGTYVVGTADHGNGYHTRAFRWSTADGMGALALPTGYETSLAEAISYDGSIVVGQMSGWTVGTSAFRWTEANGMEPIGGRLAHGISPDATMLLGISNGTAAWWTAEDGWVELAWGAWGDDMGAFATSSDHQVIVGRDGYHGYFWTPEGGTRWIENVLAQEYGVDLGGWVPFGLEGLSDDGTVLAGYAYETANTKHLEAFRAVVPRTRFERLGDAMAGQGGVEPQLYGRGDLAAGGHGFLAVEKARGGQPVVFIIGASAIHIPLFKGTLVPSLDVLIGTYTGWYGDATIGGALPSDLPSGIDFWAQAWILDPAGPKGFSATNAVKGTTY